MVRTILEETWISLGEKNKLPAPDLIIPSWEYEPLSDYNSDPYKAYLKSKAIRGHRAFIGSWLFICCLAWLAGIVLYYMYDAPAELPTAWPWATLPLLGLVLAPVIFLYRSKTEVQTRAVWERYLFNLGQLCDYLELVPQQLQEYSTPQLKSRGRRQLVKVALGIRKYYTKCANDVVPPSLTIVAEDVSPWKEDVLTQGFEELYHALFQLGLIENEVRAEYGYYNYEPYFAEADKQLRPA